MKDPIVWTVAASDSGGGAGIQADLKTLFDLQTYGCSLITAITAQNTQGVDAVFPVTIEQFETQLNSLQADMQPSVIKVGVLPTAEIAEQMFERLGSYTLVLDPVLMPSSGQALADSTVIDELRHHMACIDIITPNRSEAEQLTGIKIIDSTTQEQAARQLLAMGAKAVLLKGGHNDFSTFSQDYLVHAKGHAWLTQPKLDQPHTHGTGCTLASAIAAYLARGKSLEDAVVLANAYIHRAIRLATPLAGGQRGPVKQSGEPLSLDDFPQVSFTALDINHLPFASCEGQLGLYPVVDSVDWIERLLALGVKTIQLRIKGVEGPELKTLITKSVALSERYQARLFINDYWQLAIECGAYGVHLGQEDIQDADVAAIKQAGLRLGISTHSEYEWCYAATFKPSYLALGAVFPTDTKEVVEIGLDNLSKWVRILNGHFPLTAIGGINLGNIANVVNTGVGSVAVVSAVTKAYDTKQAVANLQGYLSGGENTMVSSDQLRLEFSRAMSDMYRKEVPLYGSLLDLVSEVNREVLTSNKLLKDALEKTNNLSRLSEERHGAIRVGTASELSTLRRVFALMGMYPVGYYDLSVAGIPVHSTAFRPIDGAALSANPFRIFTSLLRLELIEDAALKDQAQAILNQRHIFSNKLLNLLNEAELNGGLKTSQSKIFIDEVLEIFRWHDEALVSKTLYEQLHQAHRLIADVVSFKGPHINHLTPATLDIDVVQREMPHCDITPKAVIEGPPRRRCPILLRQTSFKALEEKVAFTDEKGVHTARFGEIEQRGIALTAKGQALYDQLLDEVRAIVTPDAAGSNASEYNAVLDEVFAKFPDTYPELREKELAFFQYSIVDETVDKTLGRHKTIDELVAQQLVRFDPIIYEDFLPVSAAGIFQSNLGDTATSEHLELSQQGQFEEALGAPVADIFELYQAQEQRSIQECIGFFGV